MADSADQIALWDTIGTWLAILLDPIVDTLWSYMVGSLSNSQRVESRDEIDLEAALPSKLGYVAYSTAWLCRALM